MLLSWQSFSPYWLIGPYLTALPAMRTLVISYLCIERSTELCWNIWRPLAYRCRSS
jgi:hypothetical protein